MGYELLVSHGEELVVQCGEIEGRGSHNGRYAMQLIELMNVMNRRNIRNAMNMINTINVMNAMQCQYVKSSEGEGNQIPKRSEIPLGGRADSVERKSRFFPTSTSTFPPLLLSFLPIPSPAMRYVPIDLLTLSITL